MSLLADEGLVCAQRDDLLDLGLQVHFRHFRLLNRILRIDDLKLRLHLAIAVHHQHFRHFPFCCYQFLYHRMVCLLRVVFDCFLSYVDLLEVSVLIIVLLRQSASVFEALKWVKRMQLAFFEALSVLWQ